MEEINTFMWGAVVSALFVSILWTAAFSDMKSEYVEKSITCMQQPDMDILCRKLLLPSKN